MIEFAEKKYNLKKEEILVIGDSVESDIQMANNYGCKSLLILKSGVVGKLTRTA